MSTDPADARFLQQPVDLPDGGQFTIESLFESLDQQVERLRAESAQAKAALGEANAEARAGAVTVRVDAAGHLQGIDFDPEQFTSTNRLNAWTMDAWRQAVRTGNQHLTQGLGGDLGALVAAQSPVVEPDEDERPVRPNQDQGSLVDPGSQETPSRPEPDTDPLDDWFAQLDEVDSEHFPQVLASMLENAPFEVPDLTGRTGPEIDAAFAAENQQISDALVQAGSDLDRVEETATHKLVDVTVNAAGALVAVQFHPPALKADPTELGQVTVATCTEAAGRAQARSLELLRGGGLAPDDPSAALFTPPQTPPKEEHR